MKYFLNKVDPNKWSEMIQSSVDIFIDTFRCLNSSILHTRTPEKTKKSPRAFVYSFEHPRPLPSPSCQQERRA